MPAAADATRKAPADAAAIIGGTCKSRSTSAGSSFRSSQVTDQDLRLGSSPSRIDHHKESSCTTSRLSSFDEMDIGLPPGLEAILKDINMHAADWGEAESSMRQLTRPAAKVPDFPPGRWARPSPTQPSWLTAMDRADVTIDELDLAAAAAVAGAGVPTGEGIAEETTHCELGHPYAAAYDPTAAFGIGMLDTCPPSLPFVDAAVDPALVAAEAYGCLEAYRQWDDNALFQWAIANHQLLAADGNWPAHVNDWEAPSQTISIGEALFKTACDESMSIGSAGHSLGTCKPCVFFHTKGCENGSDCTFCHLCPEDERKRRKAERKQCIRSKKRGTPGDELFESAVDGSFSHGGLLPR